VYNTYAEWKETNFPFWSENTIQRVFANLEENGLVVSIQPMKGKYDRTKYYRIDYTKLEEFEIAKTRVIDDPNLVSSDDPNLVCSLDESEITAETTPLSAEEIKKITKSANKDMDALLEQERLAAENKSKAWKHRQSFAFNSTILAFADLCVKRFGEPAKKDLSLWVMEIGSWTDAGATPDDWKRAEEIVSGYTQPVLSVTGMTKAVKFAAQERKNGQTPVETREPYHPEFEIVRADPEEDKKYVPNPNRRKP